MTDFGQSVFRLHGGTGTMADILSVLKHIHSNAEVRDRMIGVGALARDIPLAERRDSVVAMAAVYFAQFDPPEERDHKGRVGSALFIQKCCPPRGGRWAGHVLGSYNAKGKATMARLSEQVVGILVSLEHFWALPGELVAK